QESAICRDNARCSVSRTIAVADNRHAIREWSSTRFRNGNATLPAYPGPFGFERSTHIVGADLPHTCTRMCSNTAGLSGEHEQRTKWDVRTAPHLCIANPHRCHQYQRPNLGQQQSPAVAQHQYHSHSWLCSVNLVVAA